MAMSPEPSTRRFESLRSTRVRTTLVASGGVAAALIVVSLLLLEMQESAAVAHLDEILSDEAEAISRAIADNREIPILFDDDRVMFARGPDGEIVAFDGPAAHGLADATVEAPDDRGVTIDIDGEPHRVVIDRFVSGNGVGHVLLAEPRDELDDSVAELANSLQWVVPITLIALTALIWWLVGWAMRPLERMRRDVDGIGIRQLDHRVTVPPSGDEVSQLGATLNRMLGRLEHGVRRRQRFIADAAHELRTPLARMRADVEADVLDAGSVATRTVPTQLEEIVTLQEMIDDILLLARSDAATTDIPRVPIDLDEVVLNEVRAARTTSASTATIDTGNVSAAQVLGVQPELRRVVRNLLDNGLRHAATTVKIGLGEHDGRAILTVEDDGPGIPDERRAEVFERFRRIERGSAAHLSGSGLGLAIVAEVTERHDGTVAIEDSPLGGARFTLTYPLAP